MKTQLFIVLLILFTTEAFSQGMINFSGIVRDAQTGKTLEEINVFVTEKNTGTITNFSGAFFFFLSEGIYNVSFSGHGYKPETFTLDLRSDKISDIEMIPSSDAKKKSAGWLKKKTPTTTDVIARNISKKNLPEFQ